MALEAIRCGAYQILYMDRVPDSAAVNETVQAVKSAGRAQLAGFVNGVLRGLVRKKGQIELPGGDSLKALSVRFSVPEDLIKLWTEGYGRRATVQILDSLSEKPELFIRVNRARCSAEELEASLKESGAKMCSLQHP